ncbi:MAG: response regulator [Vallitaleaceae bacterium]|nr:response regulator [Vallitaleaceae bacterium]
MYKAIVVDDEKMIRSGIQKMLPWRGLGVEEVFTAASGSEALDLIALHKPEIIITDISMTKMTGIELIERIKRLDYKIKIIVLTGYDSFEYAQKCLRMQVEDFFLKPIDEEILALAIKKIVDALEEEKRDLISQKVKRRAQGTEEQLKLEKMMRDLVHNRKCHRHIDTIQREYHYDVDSNMQAAIIVPTLYASTQYSEENFLALSIKNVCIGLIDAGWHGITFMDDDGKIIIALFESSSINIVERIEQLNNILKDEFETTPKVVLGNLVKGFAEFSTSYNDAIYLMETQKESIREIIQNINSESRFKLFNHIFLELKSHMISNTGNVELIIKAFSSFAKATESYNLADSFARRCCFDIASTLYFTYISDSGEGTDGKLNALLMALLNASREDACEFTRDFITQLFSREEANIHEIVSQAKNLIDECLAEDLSIMDISSKLYITPNYFSRLFKKVTGEGCNEYIVRKRIEKAKCLLETTNMKTGRIAILVGYRDTNYFSLAFKKYTGESPTKYRENIRV